MIIESTQLEPDQMYFLLSQTVIPRPIAWVLSDSGGSYNLAPFSFFNVVASEPPVVMISVGWKDDDTRKDTWVNIQERSDFVVHIPSMEHARDVVASSAVLAHGESEVAKLNLTTVKVDGFRLPRVVGPKIAFFCEKFKVIEIGTAPQGMILGEVKKVWIDDSLSTIQKGRLKVDAAKLNPLARLGGTEYCLLGGIFDIKRSD